MSTKIKFSDVCGENIDISEDKTIATWEAKNSCGWACSEAELKPGDVIQVKVEGSGRCDIGFMKGEQNTSTFKILNEVRAHRRDCCIDVYLNEESNEICSKFNEKTFKKKTESGTKNWIAIDIRYGEMCVELSSNGSLQKFCSTKIGSNIALENDNTKAVSKNKSPASLCFLSERLESGSKIVLNCCAVTEGDRQPSRYQVKLLVSENDPEHTSNLFQESKTDGRKPPLTTVETIEKEECKGDIVINLTDDRTIQYTTAKGKQNAQKLDIDATQGVWVVLELYRVTVKADRFEKSLPVAEPGCSASGEDQPDSVPMQPRRKVTAVPVEPEGTPSNGNGHDIIKRLNSLEHKVCTLSVQPQTHNGRPIQVPENHLPSNGMTATASNIPNTQTGEKLNLVKNYPYLVQEIDTLTFCDHFFSKEIITQGQMDHIHTLHRQSGPSNANRELIKMMRGKQILKSDMEEIVEAAKQLHLLEKFYPVDS